MNIKQPEEKHIPLLRQLWKEAFGDTDDFLDTFFHTAFSFERCRCVFEDDIPVAVLYWFDCEYEGQPVAYLYAIATTVSHRGQGLCKQLMQNTHKHLESLGYQGTLLVPGENSLFSFYEKIGYKTTCFHHEFSCTGEEQEIFPHKVSSTEYAFLRRKYLPSGSIIQEGKSLVLIQSEYDFYAGKDFLFVAQLTDDDLYVLELLGNTDPAPGLVHYFKCTKGLFRTPGFDKPFAMYLPLNKTVQTPPSYLGFAFD